jgi:aminoglycoside 2''-phosphotransferase
MDADTVRAAAVKLDHIREVRETVYLGAGDFTSAWLLNGEWVCRFARHRRAARSLRREACFLPFAARHLPLEIPCPRYQAMAGKRQWRVAIHRFIPGDLFTRESFLALDSSNRDHCAGDLARFLNALHGIDPAHAARCGITTADYAQRYLSVDRYARRHLIPFLDVPAREYVQRVFGRFLSYEVDNLRSCTVLHGDFRPRHVLWDARRVTLSGVIDFGDIEIGEAAWDLVRLWGEYGSEFLRTFLRHFGTPDRETLVRRVYSFYELDEIQWAAEVCAGRREGNRGQVCIGIGALREAGRQEPWRALLV